MNDPSNHQKRELFQVIKGIKFTLRELDILSCFANGRSPKKIALLLSLTPKTIENYSHHIMVKIGCNSREGILDFLENSNIETFLKERYLNLLFQSGFERRLFEFSKYIKKQDFECILSFNPTQKSSLLLKNLKKYLKLIGISKISEKIEAIHSTNIDILATINPNSELQNSIEYSFEGNESSPNSFIKFLNELTPDQNVNEYFSDFTMRKDFFNSSITTFDLPINQKNESNDSKFSNISKIIQKNKVWWFMGVIILSISCGIFGLYIKQDYQLKNYVRSDFNLPAEPNILQRPAIESKIASFFRVNDSVGIQTLVIIGPGGSGKTTIARQFAHKQKGNIIWEINSESLESLNNSFDTLSQQLAISDEDKENLIEIQNIIDPIKKSEKLIGFVRDRLKLYSTWLLIFDNVEKFEDIYKFFPKDFAAWGNGKILITTRNTHVQNNKYVSEALQIGELTKEEKFNLFHKINSKNDFDNTKFNKEDVEYLLEKLPPYPLDISVAAYYLKSSNGSLKEYLEELEGNNRNFIEVQENLLKETNDYLQTRYGIITISIDNILNSNDDFKGLLLLLSLIDSKNIPRELLESYKEKNIIDNFIYSLNKHSLLTASFSYLSNDSTAISIHNSTQAIASSYLLKKLPIKIQQELISDIINAVTHYASEKAHIYQDIIYLKSIINHLDKLAENLNKNNFTFDHNFNLERGFIHGLVENYQKARTVLLQNLDSLEKSGNQNNKNKALTLKYLGFIYRESGDFDQARHSLEKCISIYDQYLPMEYREIADTLTYLGNVYRNLGEYDKSIRYLEKALKMYRTHDPECFSDIARNLSYLGYAYNLVGNYSKAEKLLLESLNIITKNLPNKYAPVAFCYAYLGDTYSNIGNASKAKSLLEQALNIYQTQYSKNHEAVAWVLWRLGKLSKNQRNYQEAKELFEKSRIIFERGNWNNNAENAYMLTDLSDLYLESGEIEKAEETVLKAKAMFEQNKHSGIHKCLETLSDLNQM
jgi:tetratricopeptide (TPR) repeat protein